MSTKVDIFADSTLRENQLLAQLTAATLVEIVGVVAPTGVSGSKLGDNELWTLLFTFSALRIDGGDLRIQKLSARKKVTNKELQGFKELIKPYSVIRIQGRVVLDSIFGSPQALLEEIVEIDCPDPEMIDQVRILRKPINYEDAALGTFTLDPRVNWFTAENLWNGKPVSVNLLAETPDEIQKSLETAHALWRIQEIWTTKIDRYAVQELLSLKNDVWLGEGEKAVTAEQFCNRMVLESVSVSPDGSFEFWYGDGDLFWGHSIQICGNLTEGPTHADIPG